MLMAKDNKTNPDTGTADLNRCLVPQYAEIIYEQLWRKELWDKYCTRTTETT